MVMTNDALDRLQRDALSDTFRRMADAAAWDLMAERDYLRDEVSRLKCQNETLVREAMRANSERAQVVRQMCEIAEERNALRKRLEEQEQQ